MKSLKSKQERTKERENQRTKQIFRSGEVHSLEKKKNHDDGDNHDT